MEPFIITCAAIGAGILTYWCLSIKEQLEKTLELLEELIQEGK